MQTAKNKKSVEWGTTKQTSNVTVLYVLTWFGTGVCAFLAFVAFLELAQTDTTISWRDLTIVILVWAALSLAMSVMVAFEGSIWSCSKNTTSASAPRPPQHLMEFEAVHFCTLFAFMILVIFYRNYTHWENSVLDNVNNSHPSSNSPTFAYNTSLRFTSLLALWIGGGGSIHVYQRLRMCHDKPPMAHIL